MTVAMWAPILVGVVLAASGGRLGRRLQPAVAVPLLTLTALATALATGFVLAVAAFDAMAVLTPVAELGHWSATAVRPGGAPSVVLGVTAGLTVGVLLAAAVRRATRIGVDLGHAVATCRRLGPDAGGLVVLPDDAPDAFALPGVRGRVVVSTGMLRMLPADERRVLLAHERAHLAYYHQLYVQLAGLAAAANPLLRPLAREVERAVERWADEVAAAEVGDRRLAARALARAGLARAGSPVDTRAGLALHAAAQPAGVGARALALLQPPPRRRSWPAAALIAVTLVGIGGAAWTGSTTEARFEQAQASYAVAP
jgi:Zn-dependent protease with chaperone function